MTAIEDAQRGHRKPSDHREAIKYSRQASSSGNQCWNSTMLRGKSGLGTAQD